MARELAGLQPRFVQVSIEGSEATHNRIRGPGNFARVVAALRHLGAAGVRTMISFTAHRGNYREFPEVARYHCTAGDSLLTVMPNGDLYPCRRMPVRVGNVFETTLADLYYKSPWLQRLREPAHSGSDCKGCCFNRLCRGGLKCLSYAVYGDPFRADPGCWLK